MPLVFVDAAPAPGHQGGLDHDVSVDIKMLGHVFHQGFLSVGAKKVNGNEVFDDINVLEILITRVKGGGGDYRPRCGWAC